MTTQYEYQITSNFTNLSGAIDIAQLQYLLNQTFPTNTSYIIKNGNSISINFQTELNDPTILNNLVSSYNNVYSEYIAASSYQGTIGIPAALGRNWMAPMITSNGDKPPTINTSTYFEIGSFFYMGTNVKDIIENVISVLYTSKGTAIAGIRLTNATGTQVYAIRENFSVTPTKVPFIMTVNPTADNIPSTETVTLTSLPSSTTVLSIQMRAVAGSFSISQVIVN
jgi:hypothetical protein